MYIRRTGWGFLRFTRFGWSWSAISNRCLGWTALTPSIPAVFLPWLSCVTRRTAISRADLDFIKSFWSLWTALLLPRCSARKMRFCILNTCCSNLRQGSLRQLSLSGSSSSFCLTLGAFVSVILLVPLPPSHRADVGISRVLPLAFAFSAILPSSACGLVACSSYRPSMRAFLQVIPFR